MSGLASRFRELSPADEAMAEWRDDNRMGQLEFSVNNKEV
jgi:hypothetical protein